MLSIRALLFITAAAIMTALAACGPVGPLYETHYELVPPPTDMGRMCANNCLMAQQNCRQTCALQAQQCEQMNHLQAQNDYQQYVIQRQHEKKEIKRGPDSFYYGGSCGGDYGCEQRCQGDQHLCHTNCGGHVIPRTMCVANCQPQPGQAYAPPPPPPPGMPMPGMMR